MRSCSEANGNEIDSTVGGLVWVRRRNGSWWPGRVLCPDEVEEGCLGLPRRSGTPVKLLGREDASVDWYNLEKSKRIKAFRCGEFDECIEKAKVTAPTSCKKSVKYAHREDAIRHALELEKSRLSKDNNSEATRQPDKDENLSDKLSGVDSISISPQALSRTAASADNSLDCSRRQTLNDSEDDETEGSMKRMRGLEDLGIGRAISSFKKKRTQVVHLHKSLKKKNRCHQMTKVLKKTATVAMVTVPVICEELKSLNEPGYSNNKVSHSTNDVMNIDNDANNCEQKDDENSSNSELLENDHSSGRLFDVPFIREENHTAGSSPGLVPEMGSGPPSGHSSLAETVSVGPNEFQEFGSISSGADFKHSMDNSTSEWQNKGKRNSRNKIKTKTLKSFLHPDDESRQVNNTLDLTHPQRSMPIRQSCFTGNPKYQPLDVACKKVDTGSLYDVDIEVKVGHFPQHLPYVSLLSKFMGQSVTGHSLKVEVLNDTVSDLSLNSSECLNSSCELGGANKDVEMVLEASIKPRKNRHLSNQKIRRLSSLTSTKKPSETATLKSPDFACVPLKAVFGRIHAALGISSADVVCSP